ncbi:MAG: hypothetical protein AB7F74_09305, partial [Parvibaculaceae bacterium]
MQRGAELPPPLDQDAARRAWTQLQESGIPLAAFEARRPLLDAVFGGSPFLRDLILRDPQFAAESLEGDPDLVLDRLIAGLEAEVGDEQELRRLLRVSRGRAAMTMALAD